MYKVYGHGKGVHHAAAVLTGNAGSVEPTCKSRLCLQQLHVTIIVQMQLQLMDMGLVAQFPCGTTPV